MRAAGPIPILRQPWRLLAGIGFAGYVGLLAALFVVKDPGHFVRQCADLSWERLGRFARYANYVPGRTLLYYVTLQENPGTGLRNVGGNLLGFLPFGLLLPLVAPRFRQAGRLAAAALALSTSFEGFQLLTGVGAFDVDDLMLNGAGAVLGFFALEWGCGRRAGGAGTDASVKNGAV
ncbi:MAG: hypothetical protein EOO11_19155 [Chitinophagaceae bacterium]|nr:MAG: hypothetical protein EOO11_19155 [Chitinophagaceae bacterium]